MNIKDLRYFLAVAKFEHFGKAAELCQVSQPTLSGQIKKFEEQLGVKLFERNNRRVMLTDVGSQIEVAAKRILQEVDTLYEIAEVSRDPLAGKFRLGAFPTLATYLFPQIVPKMKDALPDLRLILHEEKSASLIEKLKTGELDAALLALPVEDPLLHSQTLFEDPFYLAVPAAHPLTKQDKIDQADLAKERLLVLEEGHCLRDQALEVFHINGILEDGDFKATGLETLRQMVRTGTGMTFMPKIAITQEEPGIRYLSFKAPAPSRTIGLFWRKTTTRLQVINRLIGIF